MTSRSSWEPWEGSQTLPRYGSVGQSPLRQRDRHGNPGGFPSPPALGSVGQSPLRLRDQWEPWEGSQTLPRYGSAGKPAAPTRSMGTLEGSQTLPRYGSVGKPVCAYAIDGNPGRVPKPSRAMAPAGRSPLRLRDRWEPWRVPEPSRAWLRQARSKRLNPGRVPKPSRAMAPLGRRGDSHHPHPPTPTRSMGTL